MICALAVAMSIPPSSLWDETESTLLTLAQILEDQAERSRRR